MIARPVDEKLVKQKPEGPTTIYTLRQWLQTIKSREATVAKLIEILIAAYHNDAAEILEQYVHVMCVARSAKIQAISTVSSMFVVVNVNVVELLY